MEDRDFLEAFTEHLDRLHNLARGVTGSPQDAEDLVSETCLLALRGWRRNRPDCTAAARCSPASWPTRGGGR